MAISNTKEFSYKDRHLFYKHDRILKKDDGLFHSFFCFYKFFPYLCKVLCPQPPMARKRMKRESGESPEQSRCCEPHLYRLSLLHSPATAYI